MAGLDIDPDRHDFCEKPIETREVGWKSLMDRFEAQHRRADLRAFRYERFLERERAADDRELAAAAPADAPPQPSAKD